VAPGVGVPTGALALLDGNGDVRALEDIEAEVIRFAIAHYRGQMSEVARRLRIGRSTLYRKLDSLGLDERTIDGVTDADPSAL
jgi:DNA-binding NtrC family response regulator